VGSAACFSGPQYTIPQFCYRSAQSAITQCFQICQCACAKRNAAIADTSATHNHSFKKTNFSKLSAVGDDPPPHMYSVGAGGIKGAEFFFLRTDFRIMSFFFKDRL
jgi:hypothetical protein